MLGADALAVHLQDEADVERGAAHDRGDSGRVIPAAQGCVNGLCQRGVEAAHGRGKVRQDFYCKLLARLLPSGLRPRCAFLSSAFQRQSDYLPAFQQSCIADEPYLQAKAHGFITVQSWAKSLAIATAWQISQI